MTTLRLTPADDVPTEEPLRFPTEAVRTLNEARAASRARTEAGKRAAPAARTEANAGDGALQALVNLTRCMNKLTHDLDVVGHLGGSGVDDDDPPRAA